FRQRVDIRSGRYPEDSHHRSFECHGRFGSGQWAGNVSMRIGRRMRIDRSVPGGYRFSHGFTVHYRGQHSVESWQRWRIQRSGPVQSWNSRSDCNRYWRHTHRRRGGDRQLRHDRNGSRRGPIGSAVLADDKLWCRRSSGDWRHFWRPQLRRNILQRKSDRNRHRESCYFGWCIADRWRSGEVLRPGESERGRGWIRVRRRGVFIRNRAWEYWLEPRWFPEHYRELDLDHGEAVPKQHRNFRADRYAAYP